MGGLAADATLVAIASIAIAVAGCAIGPGPTTQSVPDLVEAASIQDVAGDVLDLQHRPGATPDYIDVRTLSAASDGERLQLTLTLADALPQPAPAVTERLTYNFEVFEGDPALPENANDFGNLQYTIAVYSGSIAGGQLAYQPGMFDWTQGPDPIPFGAPDFPGTVAVAGDEVVVTVSLAALGDPSQIWVGVKTVSTLSNLEGEAISSTGDAAPDAGRDWLFIEP